MRISFLLAAAILAGASAGAQDLTFTFTPTAIRQGETLKLHAPKDTANARMNGITIPLFDYDGGAFGLMPVAVEDEPGDYKLEFLDAAGTVIHESTVIVRDAHYPKQNVVIS